MPFCQRNRASLAWDREELSLGREALSLAVGRSTQLVLGKKLSCAKYQIRAVLLRPCWENKTPKNPPDPGSTSGLEEKTDINCFVIKKPKAF